MQKNNNSGLFSPSIRAIRCLLPLHTLLFPLSLIMILMSTSCHSAKSVTPSVVPQAEQAIAEIKDPIRAAALNAILPAYTDWQTAELSGKLRLKKLPVSPTLRIYMKRAEDISISIRVALLGEVGRIDIDKDSITAINKMKHVYCKESIAGIKYDYPDIIADVQSLLLGRVVVIRSGELSIENSGYMDYKNIAAAGWNLIYPKGRTDSDEFSYQYRISPGGLTEQLAVMLSTADSDYALNLDYTNSDNARDLNISFTMDNVSKFNTEIDFDATKWGANPPSPLSSLNLGNKYTRLDIKQFLKSF